MVKNASRKNKLVLLPVLLWNILSFVYMGVLITYYYKLNQDPNCNCSVNWKRYVLLYPLVILIPMLLAIVLVMFKKVLGKK